MADDDSSVRQLVQSTLTRHGYRVTSAVSASALVAVVAREQVDLIIADVHLQQSEGTSAIAELRASGVTAPVLFISGDDDLGVVERALAVTDAAFLPKPFTANELLTAVHATLPRL